ncbi:MAG: Hsp20/alpha crystallin family protein [Acidimicrobiia bacterium]
MLMRFDPFRELDRLTSVWGNRNAAMPIDAYRQGEKFVVYFDLPGVDPSSIDLTAEKNILTLNAQRHWQWGEDHQVVVNERPQGSFSRQLFLGEALNADGIEASYDNGVLTVTIPVAEEAKPRKVEITSGGAGAKAIEAGAQAA